MACVTCKLVNCQSGTDVTTYSLQDALFFNGVSLSFIVECPEGFVCPPGTFPRTVTFPPGTFDFPYPPNPPPGQPIILQLMGCQSLVQRILPAGSSFAAIQAAANEIIMEVAAQQAQCDSFPPEPPNPGTPPGPQPPHPPPPGGGSPPNNPVPPFMNQRVACLLTACPGDLTLTLIKSFPSWITFVQDVGLGFGQLVGAAGTFGGTTQAAANAIAQGILNDLCATAFSAGYVVCAGGGGGCAIFDALVWGAPVYVDGGVQTVTGSWAGSNFSFSILAPNPNVLASASNSASAALTLATPVIAYLDVTWVSNPGSGALEFLITVDTLLLGNIFTIDQSVNLPAWNLTTHYEAVILATTADTLLVSVGGSINNSIARTASISALFNCVPAFGNVEKTAHVDCPVGCSGAGGDSTVAANTIYKASQAEADAAAQTQADEEAAANALLPENCCCSDRPTTPLPDWTQLAWTYDGTPVFNGDSWPDTLLPFPVHPLVGTMVHTGPPSLTLISTHGFFDYPQTVIVTVTVNGVTVLAHQTTLVCDPGPTTCIGERLFLALPQCNAATIVVSVEPGGTGSSNPLNSLPGGELIPIDVLYEPPLFSQIQWGAPAVTGAAPAQIYAGKSGTHWIVFGASSIAGTLEYNGAAINCRARVSGNDNTNQWRVKVSIYTFVPGDGSTLLDVTANDANRDMDFTVPNTGMISKFIHVELFSTGTLEDTTIDFTSRC